MRPFSWGHENDAGCRIFNFFAQSWKNNLFIQNIVVPLHQQDETTTKSLYNGNNHHHQRNGIQVCNCPCWPTQCPGTGRSWLLHHHLFPESLSRPLQIGLFLDDFIRNPPGQWEESPLVFGWVWETSAIDTIPPQKEGDLKRPPSWFLPYQYLPCRDSTCTPAPWQVVKLMMRDYWLMTTFLM